MCFIQAPCASQVGFSSAPFCFHSRPVSSLRHAGLGRGKREGVRSPDSSGAFCRTWPVSLPARSVGRSKSQRSLQSRGRGGPSCRKGTGRWGQTAVPTSFTCKGKAPRFLRLRLYRSFFLLSLQGGGFRPVLIYHVTVDETSFHFFCHHSEVTGAPTVCQTAGQHRDI